VLRRITAGQTLNIGGDIKISAAHLFAIARDAGNKGCNFDGCLHPRDNIEHRNDGKQEGREKETFSAWQAI
jgi:hypothetical protein